ncbi:hypothetical protein Pcac1_g6557 [Phytophthora cactorum]|nr:hypothetical protein Pcac1_g6557 [Phytophthora cactorum]KAG2833203.1 hypothetical protein PC113_g20623 [Phytophthora cactorum]KAG3047196.1 hypothetical protein PC121_g20207 [Phytophthora cactorum]
MYVLVDAGYALHPKELTPYRGVRYHLKEFREGTGRPQTEKELFNLHPIECEFEVDKAVIFACACVHNYIRRPDRFDLAEDMAEGDRDEDEDNTVTEELLAFGFKTAKTWRDWLSRTAYQEYTNHVEE